MAVAALIELELPVATLRREFGRMTALTRSVSMQPLEREPCFRVRLQPDLARETQPTNAGVAVFAAIAKRSIMHLRVTGDTGRSHARGRDVALVVAVLALGFRMPGREAQTGMVGSDVVDLSPVGFVVTRCALCAGKRALVRIFMTGDAIATQPQICRVASTIGHVVTLRAANRCVRASERPAGHSVVEPRFAPPRPPNELGVSPEVLDVTTATVLLLIVWAAMEPLSLPDASTKIVVTSETGVGIESSPGRVALATVGVAIDLRMRAAELPWR